MFYPKQKLRQDEQPPDIFRDTSMGGNYCIMCLRDKGEYARTERNDARLCKKCIIMAAHVMGLGVIIYPPNHKPKSPKKTR